MQPAAGLPDDGVPGGGFDVPPAVRRLPHGSDLAPVWRNELGGLTFRIGAPARYVKWYPLRHGHLLAGEAERLRWARKWVLVPEVLAHDHDDDGAWLVTAALPGTSAVLPRWVAQPEVAARAIGAGLRHLHESLPVESCPFDWGVEARCERAGSEGTKVPAELLFTPPVDRLVVCHGDPCSPNTLLGEDGRFTAHVDFDQLGVADRWADLAVATYSLEWNYGLGYDGALLDAYGIAPDPERTEYYRALWDAT